MVRGNISLTIILQHLPRLTSLTIVEAKVVALDQQQQGVNLQKLGIHCLDFESGFLEELTEAFPNLESLALEKRIQCSDADENSNSPLIIAKYFAKLRQLKELWMPEMAIHLFGTKSENVNNKNPQKTQPFLKNLTFLSLSESEVDSGILRKISHHCPNLQMLDLTFCKFPKKLLTNKPISSLIIFPGVEILLMNFCKLPEEASLKLLEKWRFPKLQKLVWYSQPDDAFLGTLKTRFPDVVC